METVHRKPQSLIRSVAAAAFQERTDVTYQCGNVYIKICSVSQWNESPKLRTVIVQYLQMVIYKKQDEHQTKCQMLPVILNYWLFVAVTPNYKCD